MNSDQANEPPQNLESIGNSATAAAHPEEMRGTIRFGDRDRIFIEATARATPAGFVALALASAAVLVLLIILSKRRRA